MPDEIDRQIVRDERMLDALIAIRKPVQRTTGYCLNCDEPVQPKIAYCDADCKEDHEKILRAQPYLR